MSPSDRWRVEAAGAPAVAELFARLIESPAEERALMLETISQRWPEQREELVSLLEAHEAAGAFLEEPLSGGAGVLDLLEPEPAEGRRVGPYRVVRELGRGGMGVVYLAERADGVFEQVVALKVVPGALASSSAVERFVRERQILARLEHPHIARLLDGGVTADGLPYFAMELVEGVPVTEHCRDSELSVDDRLALFVDVCDAVSYAHSQLTVHRDLKPSNVLVTAGGGVKLLDFGIAKLLDDSDESQTVTREVAATPQYAAPEQLRGEPVSTATDIWALGVLLYELLTDRRPFEVAGRDLEAQRRLVCEIDPEPPSAALRRADADAATVRRLAGDLDTVTLGALRKEPERRYPSVEALAEDVRRHLEGLPVRVRPSTVRYRAGKFVGRHRVGVTAAVLVATSLLAGAAVALWQARERGREAVKAERVSSFLVQLFEGADPYREGGEPISFEELLDVGVGQLDTELADEPEVRAEMLQVIGKVYENLQRPLKAAPLLEQAVALRRTTLGPSHLDLAESLLDLGRARHDLGEFDAAERLYEEALSIRRLRLGTRSLEVAEVLSELSDLAYERADFERVERADREVLAIRREVLGSDHPEVATALNNLATVSGRLGRLEEAESLHRQALALRRARFGREHPDVAESWHNLAVVLERKGRLREAGEAVREALSIRAAVFGEGSTAYANSLTSLASFQVALGDHEEALATLREALPLTHELFGAEHWRVAVLHHQLGVAQSRLGLATAGEESLRFAVALAESGLGPEHWRPAYYRSTLARELSRQGRSLDEARELAAAALEVLRGQDGDLYLGRGLAALAAVHHARGALAAADLAYAEAVEQESARGRDAHPDTAEMIRERGRVKMARREWDEAERLSRSALALREGLLPPGHPLRLETELDLAEALTSAARREEALPWLHGVLEALDGRAGRREEDLRGRGLALRAAAEAAGPS